MGKVEYYSDLVLSAFVNNKRLSDRVDACTNFGQSPEIHIEDWFSWYYVLVELCFKKLAVYHKVPLNAKSHNLVGLFVGFLNPNVGKPYYSEEFKKFLETKLGVSHVFKNVELNKFIRLDFSEIRYESDVLGKLREFDLVFLRDFLKAVRDFVVQEIVE